MTSWIVLLCLIQDTVYNQNELGSGTAWRTINSMVHSNSLDNNNQLESTIWLFLFNAPAEINCAL